MNVRLLFISLLLSHGAFAQPSIKWSFNTRDASFGQSAAGDIDNDGKLEVVFGCYRNDSCVYALNGENGSLLWKFNAAGAAEGCNDTAPLIFDVDGDGKKEVIIASSCNPKTFCMNGATGAVKWVCNTRGSDSPPTVADVDGDGKPEILHGEFGGYVICINAENGSIAWELAVDTDSWIQTAPTIADLDGDGKPDFVVATWNAVNRNANKVYAFRGYDRKLLWTHSLSDVVYHGTAVGDLDGDGKPELLIGSYSDTLYCLNGRTGSVNWTYSAGSNFAASSPVIIADLDDNGVCEVVFAAWYKMIVLRADGSLKWSYDMPGYTQSFRGAAIADVNNDRYPDVIFGTTNGNLIALRGENGNLIFQKNLRTAYGDSAFEIDHAPLIADFDRDGKLDVFIVGGHGEYPDFYKDFGRAYMLSAGPGHGPDWLMFQRDVQRRGNACNDEATSVLNHPQPNAASLHIRSDAAGMLSAEIVLTREITGRLDVFNQWGQRVFEINSLRLAAGSHRIALPVASLPAGVYVCRLSSGAAMLSARFLKR
jgi:outer membrane protein assembly factor BamB